MSATAKTSTLNLLPPRIRTVNTARAAVTGPLLENGMRLDADEFLSRYTRTPEKVKAELIQGIVYMASPVRATHHGTPDFVMHKWLGFYEDVAPVTGCTNTTLRLSTGDVVQPDAMLRLPPELGGKSYINDEDHVAGPPDLVVEISGSSRSIDLHKKLESYRLAKVPEYVAWLTEVGQILWHTLENGEYKLLRPDADGITRSRRLPGLWLDVKGMLGFDKTKVRAAINKGIASAEFKAFLARGKHQTIRTSKRVGKRKSMQKVLRPKETLRRA